MNLRIFIHISEYNVGRDEYCKNKIKFVFPSQYSVSVLGKKNKVVYIVASIKLHVVKYMDIIQ